MEGLGEYLKQGRREAGLSLEDLAGRTRIRIENLERLEEGDLASLPTETYVRGFVRLVCKELGLPADEGISRYEMLLRSNAPTDEMVWSAETREIEASRLERALRDPERVVGVARRVGIGVAAVLGVLLLVVVGRFAAGLIADRGERDVAVSGEPAGMGGEMAPAAETDVAGTVAAETGEAAAPEPGARGGNGEASAAVPEAPKPAAEAARTATGAATPARTAPKPAKSEPEPIRLALTDVEVNPGQPGIRPGSSPPDPAGETDLAVAQEDAPAAPDSEREPEPTPKTEPEPARESRPTGTAPAATVQETPRAATESSSVPPEPAPAQAPPREIVAARSGADRLELEVEAVRAVELSVLLDGVGRPRTKSMQAGERSVWKADRLFVISADDAGAIRLRLSGQDLGPAGADGEPLQDLRVRAP